MNPISKLESTQDQSKVEALPLEIKPRFQYLLNLLDV